MFIIIICGYSFLSVKFKTQNKVTSLQHINALYKMQENWQQANKQLVTAGFRIYEKSNKATDLTRIMSKYLRVDNVNEKVDNIELNINESVKRRRKKRKTRSGRRSKKSKSKSNGHQLKSEIEKDIIAPPTKIVKNR